MMSGFFTVVTLAVNSDFFLLLEPITPFGTILDVSPSSLVTVLGTNLEISESVSLSQRRFPQPCVQTA